MKLVTWNINSLNLRLPRVLDWLAAHRPDVLGLQELKLEDERFPHEALREAGYESFCFAQRTYNGVALLVRRDYAQAEDVARGMVTHEDDQKRSIAATIAGVRVVCFYVPNGQSVGSEKYTYKLGWCRNATSFLRDELARHPRLALVGDFNIAPEDRDVHDPELWRGQILCSEPERTMFREWTGLGLADSFRLFDQPEKTFSYWDYRQLSFPKNKGLRIDHILLTPELAKQCTACRIDRNARKGTKPSDHAPVIVEIADAPAN